MLRFFFFFGFCIIYFFFCVIYRNYNVLFIVHNIIVIFIYYYKAAEKLRVAAIYNSTPLDVDPITIREELFMYQEPII
jgi:hypothetical protein